MAGGYGFYLHDGKTRVTLAQEAELSLFDQVPGLLLVLVRRPGRAEVGEALLTSTSFPNELFAEAKEEEEMRQRAPSPRR